MKNKERHQMNDRKHYLGASEAAAIVGLSRYRTPLDVWMEKVGQSEGPEETLAMKVGNALEPVVIGLFEETTGEDVIDRQKQILHPDHPFIRATVDGITHNAVVEAKTSGSYEGWGEEGTDEVPVEYIIQTQVQMAVTGLEIAWIPVLIGRSDFRVYKIRKNPDLIDAIIERELTFWELVQTRTMPEPKTLSDLSLAYPRDTGEITIADESLEELVNKLSRLKDEEKTIGEHMEQLETQIKSFMKDSPILVSRDGRELCSWKTQKSSRFDSKRFKAEQLELYNQYKKEAETRVFRIKKGE